MTKQVGGRVTLNGKRNKRLNGRTATIAAVLTKGKKKYVQVEGIDGLNPFTSYLYNIEQVEK